MIDSRDIKLAQILVNYSTRIQPGEKVWVSYTGQECVPLVRQIIKEIYKAGGRPFVHASDSTVEREVILGCDEEQLRMMDDAELYEFTDVPAEKMNLYEKMMLPALNERVDHTKWVILRHPSPAMAQSANMSQEAFEDFFYQVCTMDYSKMNKEMDALQDLMNRTDKVHLVGPGTDLTFSIKGIPAVKCAGDMNIPDGEVYTAPVKDSMNGVIQYNTPSAIGGFTYEDVRFEVENGKIVKATCNDDERINKYLDTDEGARYFGEFSLGLNPYVLKPMKNILFDEKISGSIHLTPGMCYEDAPNGNKSAVHWDLVLIQRPEYGGGEIWFDDRLIRKDGRFVVPELEGLNPENLK